VSATPHSAATCECATYSRHTEGDHIIVRSCRRAPPVPAIILHQEQMGSLWDLAQCRRWPFPIRCRQGNLLRRRLACATGPRLYPD
jgi:hypothetical protein